MESAVGSLGVTKKIIFILLGPQITGDENADEQPSKNVQDLLDEHPRGNKEIAAETLMGGKSAPGLFDWGQHGKLSVHRKFLNMVIGTIIKIGESRRWRDGAYS
ncbi:MAG: hypothetical protein Q7U32_03185 [Rhodocyclaceae bacterium]|nr:hypothetical protein [Rhodocyclaceae bacterium]